LVDLQIVEDAHQTALGHVQELAKRYVALGLWLIKMEEQGLWDQTSFPKFAAYAAAPVLSGGLGMKYRSRMLCQQIARKYILELEQPVQEIAEASHSNLAVFLPVVDEDNVAEVVADAKTLGYEDCVERKRVYVDGEEDLNAEEEPEICPECGYKRRRKKK
jgi:hypothetical protein